MTPLRHQASGDRSPWFMLAGQGARGMVLAKRLNERSMINDLWYKNSIVYCLSVGTFMDSNGDGIGDFEGLTRRLDYLHGLGVTTIWLMPFQTSPRLDDGYDVSD